MARSHRSRRTRSRSALQAERAGNKKARSKDRTDRVDQLLGLDVGYQHQQDHDGGWHVREIPAWRAVKDYTCPGCFRTITTGQPHLVAWRSDWIFGDEAAGEDRRHWHRMCWKNRRQDQR